MRTSNGGRSGCMDDVHQDHDEVRLFPSSRKRPGPLHRALVSFGTRRGRDSGNAGSLHVHPWSGSRIGFDVHRRIPPCAAGSGEAASVSTANGAPMRWRISPHSPALEWSHSPEHPVMFGARPLPDARLRFLRLRPVVARGRRRRACAMLLGIVDLAEGALHTVIRQPWDMVILEMHPGKEVDGSAPASSPRTGHRRTLPSMAGLRPGDTRGGASANDEAGTATRPSTVSRRRAGPERRLSG